MTAYERVIAALERSGTATARGKMWQCPSHEDREPSLSVSKADGKALLHCFAGCTHTAIVAALGLNSEDLFDGGSTRRDRSYGDRSGRSDHVEVLGSATVEQAGALERTRRLTRSSTLDVVGAKLVRVWGEEWLGFPNLNGGWKCWAIDRDGRPRLDERGKLVRKNAGSVSLFVSPDLLRSDQRAVERLFDVEGESDALACIDRGMQSLIASTGGASSLAGHERHVAWLRQLSPNEVVIVRDLDRAGREGAAKARDWWLRLGMSVRVLRLPETLGEGGDIRDYLLGRAATRTAPAVEPIGGVADLDALADAAEAHDGEGAAFASPRTAPFLVSLASVTARPVSWLWPGRIARGKLTILDGDPGLGKSGVTLDLAARVSNGNSMPDGSPGVLGDVVLLNYEDDLADTLRPRLDAAGANVERVFAFMLKSPEGERLAGLPDDLPLIESVLAERDVALVVIDPLMAALSVEVNAHRDQHVRRALAALVKVAERSGAAVVVVRHLNKGTATSNPLYRGGGSIGIIGAARSGLLVALDPDDPERRVLATTKCNLAKAPPALGFRLIEKQHGLAIEWLGETTHDASELLAEPLCREERSALDEARHFVLEALADGPRMATEVQSEALTAGIADRTLTRARRALGIKSRKESFGRGKWFWRLPERALSRHEGAFSPARSSGQKAENASGDGSAA